MFDDGVELRVHGVGRHAAVTLLGGHVLATPVEHLAQSATDAGLYALSWSRLTRTGFAAYQFALLPFALLNAAGYMRDRSDKHEPLLAHALSISGVTLSSSCLLYGVALFWDLPRSIEGGFLSSALHAVGVVVVALLLWRATVDLRGPRSSEPSLVRRSLEVPDRSWGGHYAGTVLVTAACLQVGAGGDALLSLSALQVATLALFGGLARESGTAARKLATDCALLAIALTHLVGYGCMQLVLSAGEGRWRDASFYYPEGLVTGTAEPGLDGVFVLWSVVAGLWVLQAMGTAAFQGVRTILLPAIRWRARSEGAGASDSRPRLRFRLAFVIAQHGPPRPRTSWALIFLIGGYLVIDLFVYWHGIGPTEDVPALYRLPWLPIALGVAIAVVGGVLVLGLASPLGRPVLAIVFDVIGYFPRQFHPWAPAPYADRALTDMTAAMGHLLRGPGVLHVVGHSQGSVLAYSALRLLDVDDIARCRLVTCGSPLRRLYAHFFPGWFDTARFQDVAERMRGTTSGAVWRNFVRVTDPIAAPLVVPGFVDDVPLGEPGATSRHDGPLLLHSGYWHEPALRDVVRRGPRPGR